MHTIVSPSIVNPSAAIRRPSAMPTSAVALGRARDPISGRFVAFSAPWGVHTVMLPTGIVAFRVGPDGRIFANVTDAKRVAAIRRPSYLAPAAPPRSPVISRGWESTAPAAARDFGAGLGVEVDAEDLRYEEMARESAWLESYTRGYVLA